MANLLPQPKARFFDSNGDPLVGGKLYSYAAGTTTPLATYTDQGGLSSNANPVILDANGEANIWLSNSSYKFVLKNSSDVTQWTVDNVTADYSIAAGSVTSSMLASGMFDSLSPLTTKGDLLTFNGANNVRLGVGTDKYILSADSSQSSGLLWKSANLSIAIKATTYTATTSDDMILAATTGAGWTLGLYTAVGNSGKVIRVKKTTNDTNALTIHPNGSETIDGSSTITLIIQYESVSLMSDGTNWSVVAREIKLPKLRAYRNTSTQSLTSATITKIALNAVQYDTHTLFDTVTNNNVFAPRTGYYKVDGSVNFSSSATGVREVYIYVNGSPYSRSRIDAPSAGNNAFCQISDIVFANKGEAIDLRANQSSGGALTINNDINGTFLALTTLPD